MKINWGAHNIYPSRIEPARVTEATALAVAEATAIEKPVEPKVVALAPETGDGNATEIVGNKNKVIKEEL